MTAMTAAASVSMMSTSFISMMPFMMRADYIRIIFQASIKQLPDSFVGIS